MGHVNQQMVLEISVVGKDAMYNLWQALTGNSEFWDSGVRPCHLWQKIICILKNKLQSANKALVETVHLTMGYQMYRYLNLYAEFYQT